MSLFIIRKNRSAEKASVKHFFSKMDLLSTIVSPDKRAKIFLLP